MTDTEDDTMLARMKSMAEGMKEPRVNLSIIDRKYEYRNAVLWHVGIDYIVITSPDDAIIIAADKIITWTMADGPTKTNKGMG
jgi:hypothetical protein